MAIWTLETTDTPADADLSVVEQGLHEHNLAQLCAEIVFNYARLASFARGADGRIVGGVYGEVFWQWLYIRTLWVEPTLRGRGIATALLKAVEGAAQARGIHQVHLETTDFQALDFYQKLGYTVFGELHNKPAGHTWYYIQKWLG